jgi:hypothetical protein
VADRRTHPHDVFALGGTAILSQDHINATHGTPLFFRARC